VFISFIRFYTKYINGIVEKRTPVCVLAKNVQRAKKVERKEYSSCISEVRPYFDGGEQ